jgi:hypothetical protein
MDLSTFEVFSSYSNWDIYTPINLFKFKKKFNLSSTALSYRDGASARPVRPKSFGDHRELGKERQTIRLIEREA